MKPKNITNIDWQLLQKKYPNQIEEVLNKLEKNYPVQYLIGYVDFYDCSIKVNENVLIPRFETELLVEKIIKKIKKYKIIKPNIIDLGTGSGCIAIAIKKNIDCTMTSLDISKKALAIAKENAKENNTEINFIQKDMSQEPLDAYDIIISNPPYVKKEEWVGEETKYEPQNAIFAKEKGTYFYRKILENIQKSSKKPKFVAFEIGMEQGSYIKKIANKLLPNYKITIEKDYQDRDRFIFLEKEGN